jgi:hypothetical protein
MRRDATIKPSHSWRVIVLSSGEFPIETKLNEDPKHGARAHAGQLVRAVDIPVCGVHGVFDAFDADDVEPSAFAEKCKNATSTFYGMAGPEFVRQAPKHGYRLSAFERKDHDFYPTPADLAASLPLGLSRLGLGLPRVALDPCGGDGALRHGLASFGVDVRLTDLYPDKYSGADGYVAS